MRYLFINIIICVTCIYCEQDLYDVLGITRSANSADIKKAYKKLARKWHPDKNRDESAQDIFVKINEAYETLGDENKRSSYDNFGHRSGVDSVNNAEDFGFHFNFGSRQSNLNKQRLSLHHFENSILPNSKTRPFIIFAHSTFCFPCMRIEPVWEKFIRDLEEIDLGAGTLQAQLDHALARKLRVSTIPAIIAVVDGKFIWCDTDLHVNLQHLRDFVRDKVFPTNLITKIETVDELDDFLSSYRRDNRVRAIHYAERSRPSQRFLAAAFAHRFSISSAYVSLKHSSIEKLLKKYRVSFGQESLLMFNEEFETPVSRKMKALITRSEFDQYFLEKPLLLLPRITSQRMFDEVCPLQVNSRDKKICVVLFTSEEARHDPARRTFRKLFANINADNVRFAYVYEKFQRQFTEALNLHRPIMNYTYNSLKVAILWRTEDRTVHYEWLEDGWMSNASENIAKERHQAATLRILLKDVATTKRPDSGYTVILDNDLIDEHLEYLLTRILNRFYSWYDYYKTEISELDLMMKFSLVLSIILCIFVVYFATISLGIDSKDTKRNSSKNNVDPSERGKVYIHILMRSTFSHLVLNSEPGIRLIVVLVNAITKKEIINRFSNIVYKFDNGKDGSLKFAFLDLDDHIEWYRSLLEKTLSIPSEDIGKLTAQNCIGTVLCMNGSRKYISIYYPRKWRSNSAKRTLMSQVLGFVESSDEEFSEKVNTVTDILKGLSSWLERLYEGNLKRMKLEQWPLPTT